MKRESYLEKELLLRKDLTVEIFPNPFLEGLNIKFYLPARGNVMINILSLDGKLLNNIENRNIPLVIIMLRGMMVVNYHLVYI